MKCSGNTRWIRKLARVIELMTGRPVPITAERAGWSSIVVPADIEPRHEEISSALDSGERPVSIARRLKVRR